MGGQSVDLLVRDTPTRAGHRLGLVAHLSTVWVDCVRTTDFDPDPGTGFGPRWYRVHVQAARPVMTSDPTDQTAWAYGYYLSPNGHDGQLPDC